MRLALSSRSVGLVVVLILVAGSITTPEGSTEDPTEYTTTQDTTTEYTTTQDTATEDTTIEDTTTQDTATEDTTIEDTTTDNTTVEDSSTTDTSTETPSDTAGTASDTAGTGGETVTDAANTTAEQDNVTESTTSPGGAATTTVSEENTTPQATAETTAAGDTSASTTTTTAAGGTSGSATTTTAAEGGTAASTTTTTTAAGGTSGSATTTTAAEGGTAASTTTAAAATTTTAAAATTTTAAAATTTAAAAATTTTAAAATTTTAAAATTTTAAAATTTTAAAATTSTTTTAAGGTAASTTATTPGTTSSFPSNAETTAASNSTTVASNSTTVASNSTTVASNSTTVASNSTTVAGNSTMVASSNTTVASNSTTAAGNSTTVASNSTTVASNSTTVASNSTTASVNSATTTLTSTTPKPQTTLTTAATTTVSSKCIAGRGYSLRTGSCQDCSSDEYNNGSVNYCIYCPYKTTTKTSCKSSDGAKSGMNYVDLQLILDYKSSTCQVSDTISTKIAQLFASNINRSNPNSEFCQNLPYCDNIVFSVDKADQCKLGKSCSIAANCTDFITRTTVNVYSVPEYMKISTGEKQKAIELLLGSFSNLSQVNSNLGSQYNLSAVLPPVSSNSTVVVGRENRTVYLTAELDSTFTTLQTLSEVVRTNSIKEIGQVISSFLYSQIENYNKSLDGYTTFNASLVFKWAVNDDIVNAVAQAVFTSHVKLSGKFGDSDYAFTGPVYIYKTTADRLGRKSALKWCAFLKNLQRSVTFDLCGLENTCNDTTLYYQCVSAEDPSKVQRALYPYGSNVGDSELVQSYNYWWYYTIRSESIRFAGGAPFGSTRHKIAYVQANGAITFGSGYELWWPSLYWYSYYYDVQSILAPFWTDYNYNNGGRVYYQLYERSNKGPQNEARLNEVVTRASNEVNEFYKNNFKATAVLIATWEKVEPYNWYSWICDYYRYYYYYWWWQYYTDYYNRYCVNKYLEQNTFQCIYVTDGQDAYAVVMYKKGEMKWSYLEWRNIVVGFASSETTRDYGVTYSDLTTKMDKITWNTGRYGTWIEKVGKVENPDSKCQRFYLDNKYLITNQNHQKNIKALYKCPCSLSRVGAQWWGYSFKWENDRYNSYIYCLAIGITAKNRLLNGNPLNKLCCYRYTYPTYWWSWYDWEMAWRNAPYVDHRDPDGSFLLLNDPWYWWGDARKSKEEDFNPHRVCCEESSSPSRYCALFNEVRPDLGCSLDAEFISGSALGDPHISTPDGNEYTFNGKGEYVLLYMSSMDFMFQCRTGQVISSTNKTINATVFVAFAAREESNSTFQVELNSLGTGMIILANGADITTDFYADERFNTSNTDGVKVSRKESQNKTIVVGMFPCTISIEIYVGIKNLEFSINIPTVFKNQTKGLLGNFNGDKTDDFVLPDGTILTANETKTERKIFENFGKQWEVTTSNSVFKYKEGENATVYQFFDFVPLFIEEANQTLVADANNVCGDNNACIVDFVATGDKDFAKTTLSTNEQVQNVKLSQDNKLPVLELSPNQLNSDGRIQVTHGQVAHIKFNATDPDVGDVITYQLVGNTTDDIKLDGTTGVVTYTPNAGIPLLIGVQAVDSKNGTSSIVTVTVVVCPSCSKHGDCNTNLTRDEEHLGGKFLVNLCMCWVAYIGDDCEREVNGCLSSPCTPEQGCTDLSAAVQGNNSVGYKCGDCPSGYTLQNSTCADVNECLVNGANSTNPACPDHAYCINSVGSYSCQCDVGYRLDNALCKDVDECAEKTHKCQHICNNTDGSYECACYDGSHLDTTDNKTCIADQGATCTPSCAHICVVKSGHAACACKSGYNLHTDNTSCNDIDECTTGNKPCSQACQNTDGGFKCSCYLGYKLLSDGVTCQKCDKPYYGNNCSSQCVCNGLGSCDNIKGCVCNAGWTGTNCNNDVDECATNSAACPNGQICTNSLGSYTCSCPSGYTKVGDTCSDINECLDVLTHNCTLSVEDCINNKGGYSCVCRSGYARKANKVCEDIDECASDIHNCEHLCENVPGKFNCYCRYGYKLDIDRAHCVQEKDVCAGVKDLNCSQNCTVDWKTNVASCFCISGYELVGKELCEDKDECKYEKLNLCSYKEGCVNKVGGYTCSCPAGSQLDNDGRTCVACGTGKWGVSCSNDCACGIGASSCDPKNGCVCKTGFTGTHCEKDVDECATGQLTCTATENCVNTFGSATCSCLEGYVRINNICQDINECASLAGNDCDQVCENFIGGYGCSCYSGYKFNTTSKGCQDIDECSLKLDGCQKSCENIDGGYRCTCPSGLKLAVDGKSCVVSKQCHDGNSCEQSCFVNASGVETCFCKVGFSVNPTNSSVCDDVDFCADDQCTDNCTETDDGTSYVCSCPAGKKLATDRVTCVECISGTYGISCASKCECEAATTASCDKVSGMCTCKVGFTSATCADDIDECSTHAWNCPSDSHCFNTPGSYLCKCNDGFYKNGNYCTSCPSDFYGQECTGQCQCDKSHGTCNKVDGTCTCSAGWGGNVCDTDVDECLETNNCTLASKANWVCINTPGSYKCDCDTGFEDMNGTCVDLDECLADSTNDCEQNCTNSPGSYTCSCSSGYILAADKRTCDDINECDKNSDLCEQLCENSEGAYNCTCNTGYQVKASDWKKCYKASDYKLNVKIDKDVSRLNIKEKTSQDYKDLKALVESSLLIEFSKTVEGLTGVEVTDLRSGSLIVDFRVIVDIGINPNADSSMVVAVLAIKTSLTIGNDTYNVTSLTYNSVDVPADSDLCTLLTHATPCQDNKKCVITSSGVPQCQSEDDGGPDVPLIVGLSVGLPLLAVVIVAIIVAVWYKKKYTNQRRVNSRIDEYQDGDRPPSAKSNTYFAVAPVKGDKVNDKENLVI